VLAKAGDPTASAFLDVLTEGRHVRAARREPATDALTSRRDRRRIARLGVLRALEAAAGAVTAGIQTCLECGSAFGRQFRLVLS
jgi:hypothetical protein